MTQQQKYSFDIRVGTTNQDEPITQIDKTVIAYSLDTVIDYCQKEYDMIDLDEVNSDLLYAFFEKSYFGQISDHGNINEVKDTSDILDDNNEIKEEYQSDGYGEFRDIVDISGAEISEQDYKYMVSGNYHNSVVDLTEELAN